MKNTTISWTDHTFNPWWGCTQISPGCAKCYAKAIAERVGRKVWSKSSPRYVTAGPWAAVERSNEEAGKAGRIDRVFCGSMMDIFEDHPTANEARPRVWDLIRDCTNLDFQLLTKRPENIAEMLPPDWGFGWDNVWLGTSIESAEFADRAEYLRKIRARVHFISYEPALGPLAGALDLAEIDWLIYGGESGPSFRPDNLNWARDMLHACREAGVAFFFKQIAARRPGAEVEIDGELIQEFPAAARRSSR